MTPLQVQGYTDLSHVAKLAGGPAKYMKEHDLGIAGCKLGTIAVITLSVFLIAETIKERKRTKLLNEYIEKDEEFKEE